MQTRFDNWESSGVYDRSIQAMLRLAIGKVLGGKCDRDFKFWEIQVQWRDLVPRALRDRGIIGC
jgi:hypothetical protein